MSEQLVKAGAGRMKERTDNMASDAQKSDVLDRHDLIVIGGGPAGVTAALRASELGADVALVERDRLGGTCTNNGCVPTRVLARAARLRRNSEAFGYYGLLGPPPEVDFQRLLDRVENVVYSIHEKKQLIHHLKESQVAVHSGVGEAVFLDEHLIQLGDGSRLKGDRFIICVGGHPRRIDFPGAEHALTHSDVWTMRDLPESLAIIGGAATGCQLATIFDSLGANVTIVERDELILNEEDEALSTAMHRAFERRGIRMVTGSTAIEKLEVEDGRKRLHLMMGDRPVALDVESVLMAVGWVGNLDGLQPEAAGVHVHRGYIPVDDHLCTNVPHIFAAGDITGRMMLVQSGGYEARVAAENALLGPEGRIEHHVVPHGGFTDPEYAAVGLTERDAKAAGHEYVASSISYDELDRAIIDGRTEGFAKLIVSAETHRILGAHVVGEQALEVVQMVAAGMASDMWIEQLAELEIAYPTFAGALGLAARQAVRKLGVMPLAPQWRALGKPLAAEWERHERASTSGKNP
jgi:pyruvate/2-oxoglutarate dehydrogenase complex dihydrolipoamide dehydrogenase (E3) component